MIPTPTDRWIEFQAVFNFRDLGGLRTQDGRELAWRRLFRSDTLSRLAEADQPMFEELGVHTVLDLRRPAEVVEMGRVPDWTGARWMHNHLDHPLWDNSTYSEQIGVARWLADRYAELAEHGAADIARAIDVISQQSSGTTVVHCVAGKDRTGLVIALTLSLLGVSDEEIAADYALTELSEAAFVDWLRRTRPQETFDQPPFYAHSPAEAMLVTLHELRRRHGSVAEYLARAGLTGQAVESLREKLLEDL